MSSTVVPDSSSAVPVGSPAAVSAGRDARSFWRVLIAVLAPLPLLGMGISYLISPYEGDAGIPATVEAMKAHPGIALTAMICGLFFLLFLIPATAALAWTTRRRAPVLTTVGACIAMLGFLAAFPLLPSDNNYAWVTARNNLDVAAVSRLDDALWAQPIAGVAALLFLAGIVIGLPLLGIAMWRTKTAPAWLAACLIAGTVTHPFLPGHVVQGVGLLVGGIGFLAVSRALLRMRDDEFDLPPRYRV
jgi:hypothetical protein